MKNFKSEQLEGRPETLLFLGRVLFFLCNRDFTLLIPWFCVYICCILFRSVIFWEFVILFFIYWILGKLWYEISIMVLSVWCDRKLLEILKSDIVVFLINHTCWIFIEPGVLACNSLSNYWSLRSRCDNLGARSGFGSHIGVALCDICMTIFRIILWMFFF